MPALCLSAKSVSALKTSPSRTDVLVLSSYLLFLQELQPVGGCLCHSYIIHVLWLGEDVPFPCLLLVLLFSPLLIGRVHIDSEALCSIAFYLPVSGSVLRSP